MRERNRRSERLAIVAATVAAPVIFGWAKGQLTRETAMLSVGAAAGVYVAGVLTETLGLGTSMRFAVDLVGGLIGFVAAAVTVAAAESGMFSPGI